MTENKNQFLNILLVNYQKLTWERDNFEFTTSFGDYQLSLDTATTGTVLRVIRNTDNYESNNIWADDYADVQKLYDGVFEFWNNQQEDKFWYDAIQTLSQKVVTV